MKNIFCICVLAAAFYTHALAKSKEVEIPRTAYKDLYKYYVVEESKKNTNMQLIYKRVGQTSFDYGIVEINCAGKVLRLLGTTTKSVRDISTANPGPWSKAAIGSIEADMIAYTCR
jgi:hypothetical protein